MSHPFQFRLSHLLLAVGFACVLAFVASLLQWSAHSWLGNCFALSFVTCALVLLGGFGYVLFENLKRRRSQRLPERVDVPGDVIRPQPTTHRLAYSKQRRRQTIAFKW